MNWVFSAFLIDSLLHMGEEYFYPGGFMDVMKRFNPRFAPLVTAPMAVIVNGMQLLICIVAMALGSNAFVFSMSVAGLLFINGWMHIGACLRARGYSPGAVTGAFLYIPLSMYAYVLFISTGQLTTNAVIVTGVLGLLYQAIPISYFVLGTALRHT